MNYIYFSVLSIFNFLKIIFLNKKFKEVIIFSENRSYYFVFFELIEKLKKEKKNFLYVTSDYNDIHNFDLYGKNIYIGKGIAFILFVNFVSCQNLIMTLTDLNNNKFKKSLFCKNFVYIFHSLMSTHKTYTEAAFDHFDLIFTCGQYQKDEIRKREEIKKLKKKKIINSGYLYFDYLNNLAKKNHQNAKTKILIAPSWSMGEKDFINNDIEHLIELVLNSYDVIFRPHPESFIRSKLKLDRIEKKFSNNTKFYFDKESSNIKSMQSCNLLITDGSGISMEYLFFKKEPVIYIDIGSLEKIHNPEYHLISNDTFENEVKVSMGVNLKFDNINTINKVIEDCLTRDFRKKIKLKSEKMILDKFPNPGKTAEIIYNNLFTH